MGNRIETWKIIAELTGFSESKLRRAEHWEGLPRIPVFRMGPGKTLVCVDEDALRQWMMALKAARAA